MAKGQVQQLEIAGVPVTVKRKRMKYLRLAIKPPLGEVHVSVPWHASRTEVVDFVHLHRAWILEKQREIESRPKIPQPTYSSGEQHYLWGQLLPLALIDKALQAKPSPNRSKVFLEGERLNICAHMSCSSEKKADLLQSFYRQQLCDKIPQWVSEYEALLGVKVSEWRLKKMKTRWGTCNISVGRIWLNVELAKYPSICLRYVVLHEMVHLLERNHNRKFWNTVSKAMPEYKRAEDILKQAKCSKFVVAAADAL